MKETGRPRLYSSNRERQRAYRVRKKAKRFQGLPVSAWIAEAFRDTETLREEWNKTLAELARSAWGLPEAGGDD